MNKVLFFLGALLLMLVADAQQQNLMSGRYDRARLQSIIIPKSKWIPFPKITDRPGWEKADLQLMDAWVTKANGYINYQWPSIPATVSLLIARTGDRETYQSISFKKREVLGTLVLAEIRENKGRFVDQIANGVWSICEESWWGASAHIPKGKEFSGLADAADPFVELFGAETASFLAWVDYYIGDKLDAVSPQLRKRIYDEVNKRIFTPVMTKPHGWMQANANGRRPNNWNPWICSNWLTAGLLLEKDENRRLDMVAKILKTLDEFLNPYPADGGCDEGPGYWNAAAASLYDNVAMLNLASNNAFSYVCDEEKVKNMGRYIYRVQISPTYFVDFADASPKPVPNGSLVYRFGKDIKDADMMRFGAYYRRDKLDTSFRFQYFRLFFEMFMQDEFKNAEKGLPLPADVWMPDLQVMASRDKAGTTQGWFMAAKGGNNDESHNHNDVGNFIVYYDGMPVVIDVGSGTYTARTFSDHRYDIWFNCSDYHNLPDCNGVQQRAGAAFKAEKVEYKQDKTSAMLSLDITRAWPTEAGLKSYKRAIRLNHGKGVEIKDQISFNQASAITEHLMTPYPATLDNPGQVVIHGKAPDGSAKNFVVRYDPKLFSASVEKRQLGAPEDKGVINNWGEVYRIIFAGIAPKSEAKISFQVSMQ